MFTVDQKIGNHVYVYEVHSYWDKEKKSPRQQRVRIGKRDPETGELIPVVRKRRSSEYGVVYFLASLIDRLGLRELLFLEFPEEAREILLAASFQVAEHKPFYLCNSWLENLYLKEPCKLSSQKLSRLIHEIGGSDRAVARILDAWAESLQEHEFIVFDITSISTYSHGIDYAEWGYNRDGDQLTQVNFGVVYGEPSNLPLLYSVYPGSIPDVSTLGNIKKRLAKIAQLHTLFVLDRGFYSTRNLALLSDMGEFIIPLPISIKIAKELIETHRDELGDPDNAFRYGKQLLYTKKDTVTIGEERYTAYVYLNEKQGSDGKEKLVTFLLHVEEEVARKQWASATKLIRFLDDNFHDWQQYFTVEQSGTRYTVVRKRKALEGTVERQGMLILITNSDVTAEQALNYYRRKDGVEKLFDSMKHGIDLKRLRVHNRQSMEGLLFINFLSLILYATIQRTLRETDLGKKQTVQSLFYELKKLSVIEIDEKKPMITELTRKQKDIFGAFEIPLPVTT